MSLRPLAEVERDDAADAALPDNEHQSFLETSIDDDMDNRGNAEADKRQQGEPGFNVLPGGQRVQVRPTTVRTITP